MNETVVQSPVAQPSIQTDPRPRLRFPTICLILFWGVTLISAQIDKPYFIGFMLGLGTSTLFGLCFIAWWWFARGLRLWEKSLGFVLIAGGAWTATRFSHHTINFFVLWMLGLPILAALAVGWLRVARDRPRATMRLGFVSIVILTWGSFLLVRTEGSDSRLKYETHWRWTPTTEERFLAKASPAPKSASGAGTVEVSPVEWPEYRGANRDGVVHGTTISTNWSMAPELVWKRDVGPAWSSVTVIGNQLFTQEQRGLREFVVCYDAATGNEVWTHDDETRFEESVSGIGPRATPTFHLGRLYTLGGTGILNCLDAATGKLIWKREITKDAEAAAPGWGFSSSPLIAEGKVIVHAGGKSGKGLLAYQISDGDIAWTAEAGESSYSSPQAAIIGGVSQCLMMHDGGLYGIDMATGKKLWSVGSGMKGAPRYDQPRAVGEGRFFVGGLFLPNSALITVAKNNDQWNVTTNWVTKDLKPEFPDFVVFKDHAYGFDVSLFACVNLADGKRTWKEGRFGRGEVILLADQALLLVSSETGDLILLAADPAAYREFGRFKAIQGKTWNGPVVRGNQIFIRNAQEMACYTTIDAAKKIATR